MKTTTGDLWEQKGWLVIPVNTQVNSLGNAVMGLGVAKQAALKFPQLPQLYGHVLKWTTGEKVFFFAQGQLICAPTKRRPRDKSSLSLIADSLRTIVRGISDNDVVFLPLLGCGYGELEERDVLPILEALDDRFILVRPTEEALWKHAVTLRPSAYRRDRTIGE